MRVCILISAICILTVPTANAQGLPTEEFLVDTSGTHSECLPAVAFDGENFLVVWEDDRNSPDTSDIYGARVTPAGTVLDPTGIAISTAAYWQQEPAVAFDGANYLVVWEDDRNERYQSGIYGARVTPAGVVLDSEGIVIASPPPSCLGCASPVVAFDGTNFLAVWEMWWDMSVIPSHLGTRVTPGGVVLDTEGITVPGLGGALAVAFDDANYLVAYRDYRSSPGEFDIYGVRVTPTGVLLDTGIAICTTAGYQGSPAIAFDGANFLVVWHDRRGHPYIYGARVSRDGAVLDIWGIPVLSSPNDRSKPATAFDGTDFLVVWEDNRDYPDTSAIYGARVRSDGAVFDKGPIVRQEGDQTRPALATGAASELLLAYQGWAGTLGNKTYNTDRIWYKMNPSPGIQEGHKQQVTGPTREPTVVRGMLYLKESASSGTSPSWLLDVSGRKVLELQLGANDVRHLSPGVYFVHSTIDNRQSKMTKVVVTR